MNSITGETSAQESPLVLACSPRKGGNSDTAAALLSEGLLSAGASPKLVHLRDLDLKPCRGCQACGRDPQHRCVLMERDQSEELFRLIMAAPMLFFASPIFYYHLPATFKGFIDRGQRFYEARLAGDPALAALAPRLAHMCMVSGRPRGEKLFEGSFLTMRYFLWPFNATLGEPLLLPGYDGPDDLSGDESARARVREFATNAWTAAGR
jgi:NAD(P)H-dependent FMN reductase